MAKEGGSQELYTQQGIPLVDGLSAPLPWQKVLWSSCVERFYQNKLPHALLLNGPSGVGKRLFATQLAMHILCEEDESLHDHQRSLEQTAVFRKNACGQCNSCQQVIATTHPDLLFLAPPEKNGSKKGVENTTKSSIIKIDAVRQVLEFLSTTSVRNTYKVVVVHSVESLNLAAQNALLKTLEEPSARTVFILVSHRLSQLLPTIQSRCQHLTFGLPDKPDMMSWWSGLPRELTTSLGDPDQVWVALKAQAGAPLRLLQAVCGQEIGRRALILQTLLESTTSKVVTSSVQALLDQPLVLVLEIILSAVNDLLKLAMGVSSQYLAFPDATSLNLITKTAYSVPALRHLLQQTQQLILHLWRQASSQVSYNEQHLLERALISWQKLFLVNNPS